MGHRRALFSPPHMCVMVWLCICGKRVLWKIPPGSEGEKEGLLSDTATHNLLKLTVCPWSTCQRRIVLGIGEGDLRECLWHSSLPTVSSPPPPSCPTSSAPSTEVCSSGSSSVPRWNCKWKGGEGDYRLGPDYMHCLPLKADHINHQVPACGSQQERRRRIASSTDLLKVGIKKTCKNL